MYDCKDMNQNNICFFPFNKNCTNCARKFSNIKFFHEHQKPNLIILTYIFHTNPWPCTRFKCYALIIFLYLIYWKWLNKCTLMPFLIFHLGRNCYLKVYLFFCKKELRTFNFFFFWRGGGELLTQALLKAKKGRQESFHHLKKKIIASSTYNWCII